MKLMFTTVPGIEDVVIRELDRMNINVRSWEKIGISELGGRIIVDLECKSLNFIRKMRSIEKAYIVINYGIFEGKNIEDLEKLIHSIDIEDVGKYLTHNTTFAVRSVRAGNHNFTSMDIMKIFGEYVRQYVKRTKGYIPIVDLENPDVVIEFDIIGNRYILSIEIVRRSLRHRPYRVYHHEATINPPLAYAMNVLLDYDPDGRYLLLDPLCGSGTIIIEGLNYYRNSTYIGVDIDYRNCLGSIMNVREADIYDRCCIICSDSTRLSKFIKSCDGIVTNPPYGVRMEPIDRLDRFYNKILNEFYNIIDVGSRVVFITSRRGIVDKILRKLKFRM